jgi:hypothetical protein
MRLSNQAILDYIAAHPGARREDIRRQSRGRPLVYWFNADKWGFLSEGHCEERSDEAISDDKADCHALRARNDTVFTAFALIWDISPFLTLLQGSSPATSQPAPPAS